MSLVPNLALGGSSGNQGYNIQRSLRFRSSASAYLSRTPASAGNQQKMTFSCWFKRGKLGVSQYFVQTGTSASTAFQLFIESSDTIWCYGGNGASFLFKTTQVFRDPSAWYHIVCSIDTTQATAANRVLLYINNVQITSFSTATYPAQNSSYDFNSTNAHYLGRFGGAGDYWDGYWAELNWIDGQALTPSSFGQTDTITGVWTPKKYTGTYGTNGFYLPFSDNTSATTLAYDKSGNGNNWTANNISTTAGATYDSMTDVPTLTSATAANYCVLNPLNIGSGSSLSSANLNFTTSSASGNIQQAQVFGGFGLSSGKWYWEVSYSSVSTAMVGVCNPSQTPSTNPYSNSYMRCYRVNGNKENGTTSSAYGASWTSGNVIGIALDVDAGTITFYKDNSSQGVAFSDLAGNTWFPYATENGSALSSSGSINFGQRPFQYTPPTGFVALNTFNLPDPTIKKPNQYMDATTYTGDGTSSRSITNAGGFQPDLVWGKNRSGTNSHVLVDSVRGATKQLYSNLTFAEETDAQGITAFNVNGFTVGTQSFINGSGSSFVGWQWKKGATPGFDIVTYTGTGSARTVAHSLGVAPSMMIIKKRNNSGTQWFVYHASVGAGYYLLLSATNAKGVDGGYYWNGTAPTSSVFTVSTDSGVNANGDTFVAYLFAEIAGFSKFGSYTGNGSADGPFVYCGFRPKFVMWKRTDRSGDDWWTYDAARDTYNVASNGLRPNLSAAEYSAATIDLLSNGFKLKSTTGDQNGSGGTYIYAAFAENPFKYSLAR